MDQYDSMKSREQQSKIQQKIQKQRELMEENDEFVSDFHVSSTDLPRQPPPRRPSQNPPQTARFPASTTSNSGDPRSSSPVAPLDEEDEMIDKFWEMKIAKAPPRHREKLRQAREKIDDEMWSSTALQKMSDPSSELFKRAAAKGIPEGLLLSLRPELHDYKEVYRTGRDLARFARGGT